MIRQPTSRKWRIGFGLGSLLVISLLYTGLSYRQHQINPDDTTIPSWRQLKEGVVKVFGVDAETGASWIWTDTKATAERLIVGLFVGVFLSVIIGVGMGCYGPAEAVLLPPLSVLAKIPPTAMLAVFLVMFSTGFTMYVAMIVFGVLPTLAQAVHQAAKQDVSEDLVFKSYTLGTTQLKLIWYVVCRQIFPRILEAVRLQTGPAMVFLIAAEWMLAEVGFGYRLRIASRLSQMNVVYVYLAVLGVAGFLMDYALSWSRRKLCPWFGR